MSSTTSAKPRLPAADRRELIELEATRLFGLHGYAATRLEEVATAAGVTKPMVYRHFASKKELYLALLRRHQDDLPTFIPSVPPDPDASLDQRLGAILDGWLDYARANSSSWLIIFRDKTGDQEIEAARAAVNDRATEVLAEFMAELVPRLPRSLVEPSAEFLSHGLAGVVLWWTDNPGVPKAVVHAAATRMCVATLRE